MREQFPAGDRHEGMRSGITRPINGTGNGNNGNGDHVGSAGHIKKAVPDRGRTTQVVRPPGSGSQYLVEDAFGLGLVSALRQCQLGNQDLPGLGQHPLLAG
jgi:hypothetical protein